MKVTLVLHRDGESCPTDYEYRPREEGERPMALDVLLQAQASEIPDLSYRYGCRNRVCGLCTVDVNGRPRLSCRARVKDGDTIASSSWPSEHPASESPRATPRSGAKRRAGARVAK